MLRNPKLTDHMITIRKFILLFILALVLSCQYFVSCKTGSLSGRLIITQVPGNNQHPDIISGESWRYPSRAHIAALDTDNPESITVLTDGFYSACSPEISYDGKYMLFAGQQNEGDLWQIWEMNLDNMKTNQVTSFKGHCIDPAYLPGGRLVFTRLTENDTVKTAHCLYTCNLDGSDVRQITFHPNSNYATTVLKDGRLLTISRQLFPDGGDQMFMVLRPDGTKADMFYKGNEGTILISNPRETSNGKIYFIETNENSKFSGDIVSVDYNRPLHTWVNYTAGINGSFYAVLPEQSGKFMVSFRESESERYALYEFDPVNRSLGNAVYHNPDYDITDIVKAVKYDRPRKLPSEVDMHVKTGLLLCQDIHFMGFQSILDNPGPDRASMIEVLGIDSTYGVVPVEEDGSFYLKVLADTPFRIQTLDKDGHVLYGPCSWLYLRPNERRGCVGCHENLELVPVNRIPVAVRSDPVIIPVHITEIKEKVVELE
ncbi:MAG: hypothetical protein AMS27_02715 [Bacteroides sp. SM23_62_1]|nr:MAG: hypothetical protein AMS27_02715 [Bacteroides sp. SM23_62_1]